MNALTRTAPAFFLASVLLSPPLTRAEPAVKRTEVGKNVCLEVDGKQRRVVVQAVVCLREGPLEGLLTRKKAKEHEYLLAADIDARHLHTALLLAGAKPGKPVSFLPKYVPASGSSIRVNLRYTKDAKPVTVPAREWVRHARTRQPLDLDWVFGGSRFIPNPQDDNKPTYYAANYGDVICVCNMDSALLDLPVQSPKKFDIRLYEAATERIPPKDTAVEVILEPVAEKK